MQVLVLATSTGSTASSRSAYPGPAPAGRHHQEQWVSAQHLVEGVLAKHEHALLHVP